MVTGKHYCNTDHPQRPCCWAARKTELTLAQADDDARKATYGASSCAACGRIYSVRDGVVEDHAAVCQPLTNDQRWG